MIFKIIVVALLIFIAIDVEDIVKIMKEHNSNEDCVGYAIETLEQQESEDKEKTDDTK